MDNPVIEKILSFKSGLVKETFRKNDRRWYLTIDKKDLPETARYMFKDLGLRFSTASAIDLPYDTEILYHFSYDKTGCVITLRVFAGSRDKAVMPSLTPVAKAFEWIEREIHELFGVDFEGHPDLKRLLLTDDWPQGEYPLRQKEKGR